MCRLWTVTTGMPNAYNGLAGTRQVTNDACGVGSKAGREPQYAAASDEAQKWAIYTAGPAKARGHHIRWHPASSYQY